MHVTALNPGYLRREDVDPALVEKRRDVCLDEALRLEAEKIKAEAERLLALPDQQIQDPNNLEKMTSSHGRARGDLKKVEGMSKNKRQSDRRPHWASFLASACLLEQIHANQAKYGSEDDRRVGQGRPA